MSYTPDDLIRIMLEQKEQGFDFTTREIEIQLLCNENARSINQLARIFHITYQGVYKYIKLLEAKGRLTSISAGGESYYSCPFDLTKPMTSTIRTTWKKNRLDFEEVIGLLASNWMDGLRRGTIQAVSHQYYRLQQVSTGQAPLAPGSYDVKEFLHSISQELMELAQLIRQLAELPIYDDHPKTLDTLTETFKYPGTSELIDYYRTFFINRWQEKQYTRNGINVKAFNLTYKDIALSGIGTTPWKDTK